jgi:hypothetical protein
MPGMRFFIGCVLAIIPDGPNSPSPVVGEGWGEG